MDTSKNKPLASSMVRAGKRTFFFDVKLTSDRKKFLKITESTFQGEGKERKYSSFFIFGDHAQDFQDKLNESIGHLA
ncbi:DUF3276 family protein [Candidatus Microgenomates bacterium]|nr:DUF3276 family protein [Candidatus Microgenomates bacterium]